MKHGEGAPVRIHLLGGFRVLMGDEVVLDQGWSRRKALALLKVVALQPSGQLLRDQVCELLWPDLEPKAATNNLHKNLHYLREGLGQHSDDRALLSLTGDLVRLAPNVEVDFRELLSAAAAARGSKDTATYERALAYAKHELLPEDAYEQWAAAPRESLRATTADLLREASALYIAAGKWDTAVRHIQDLLAIEPADEDAHLALMQLYSQSGSRHRALRQFEICRESLASELGVEPSAATVALHEKLLADEGAGRAGPHPASPTSARPVSRPERPPLSYGRERELAMVEAAIDEAVLGHGSMLLIVGEAGIGKSHLLRHVRAASRSAGALPLYGRAYEFDAQAPYQPLRGILDDLTASELAPIAEQSLRHSLYLGRLLPNAERGSRPPGESVDLQGELFEEVWRLLSGVAAERPLVLLLDDIHAADEGTLRLVHFLARRAPQVRVLLVATARADWTSNREALNALRAALRRDAVAQELGVQPLDEQALRLVVQSAFGDGRVDVELMRDVIERSQGNPLLARELTRSFVEEGWAWRDGDVWKRRSSDPGPVPVAAYDMLRQRLEHLGKAARDLVNAAAVSPVAVSFPVLEEISGLARRDALDALDACIEAGLLEEGASGYRFHHELIRQAAYRALTAARRQQLHHATAEAMIRRPDQEPGIVSHHLVESDEPWRAIPHLLEVARQAETVFANGQAKEAAERAVQLTREHESLVDADIVPRALEALGDLERRLGNISASVPLYEEAAARFEVSGHGERGAQARGKAALGHIVLGNAEEARRHIEETLQVLTDQSPHHVVSRTYYLLAQLHWHSGDNEEALAAAEKALLAAQDDTDPSHQAQAYEVLALACHSLGDWQQGIEYELNRQALGVSGFDADEAFDAHL